MPGSTIEERLSNVELALAEFIIQTNKVIHRMEKDTQALKEERREFKAQAEKDRRIMNKQRGERANKMGTLVENIIAPGIRPVIARYYGEEVENFMPRVQRRDKKTKILGEFDVVAVTSKHVFLVETKSAPKLNHLDEMNTLVERFRKLFPEYKKLPVVPILAGLRFDESFYQPAAEKGILLLGFREWEYLDFLNFDLLHPKAA